MHEQISLAVSTEFYGSGRAPRTEPRYVLLNERRLSARELIAEYVRAELAQAQETGAGSLALSYLLAENSCLAQAPRAIYDAETEIIQSWSALQERRYMLLVDGEPIAELDTLLTLTERSRVSFIRLLPMIGG